MNANAIKEIENTWIIMQDGTRLAARIWMPENSEKNPVPCIFEYIPYRKRDFTSQRDEGMHKYFAGRGYACIRVDMRGSGDSDGVLMDEYLPIEQADGLEVINWIIAQDWCDGNVGMIGLSWGAIATLQMATHSPKALKAIVPVGASIDRYYDDAGYFAGAYLGETIGWGAVMFAYNTFPPDPAVVGKANWKQHWLNRLEKVPSYLSIWLDHPRRDAYWLQGTVVDKFDQIKCPIYVVSGWNDCWPNTVLRVMQKAKSPVWGMSGIWGHKYPHLPFPGPGMNFLDEICRFWDKHLQGIDNGFEQTSPLNLYVQTQVPADPKHVYRDGYWVAEPAWPSPNVEQQTWYFESKQLSKNPAKAGEDSICSGLHVGYCSGEYMPLSLDPELEQMPMEQSREDAESLVYQTEEFREKMVIMGTSIANLRVKSDHSCGLVAVRLCDVDPEGKVSLVSYGVLNLAQRNGREDFSLVKAGRYYDVQMRLNDIAHEIQQGHKLRLSISANYFPMAWPLGEKCTITIDCKSSDLILPIRHKPDRELPVPETYFQPPKSAKIDEREEISPCKSEKNIQRNGSRTVMRISEKGGRVRNIATDWTYGRDSFQTYVVDDDEPLKTTATYETKAYFKRGDFEAGTQSVMVISCDEKDFILEAEIKAFHLGEAIFERSYEEYIPRYIF